MLRINPKSEKAYSSLIEYLIGAKHLEEAKHYAFQFISINKHNCEAYRQMGTIFKDERRYRQSLYCFGLSLSLHNRQFASFRSLGELFDGMGWLA
jgi:tetratricopeptide (TPR) repeat protein